MNVCMYIMCIHIIYIYYDSIYSYTDTAPVPFLPSFRHLLRFPHISFLPSCDAGSAVMHTLTRGSLFFPPKFEILY